MARLGAAMTNTVFIISHDDDLHEQPTKMLLRVYGVGVDHILDRKQELDWFSRLSDLGVGPKLHAAFKNGRLEEFIESEPLTPLLMRDPRISRLVATSLARFHATIKRDDSKEHCPILWSRLESWRLKAIAAYQALSSKNASPLLPRFVDLGVLSKDFALGTLVNWRNQLSQFETLLVFSHNDLQHGNILLTENGRNIVIIDYEYGGVNFAAYDIANHFCEWASDFTEANSHPEIMDFANKYPNEVEQRNFIKAYLEELYYYASPPTEESIDAWVRSVEHFKFISNVIWGYWGVIQALRSDIQFDYLAYALCRFEEAHKYQFDQKANSN